MHAALVESFGVAWMPWLVSRLIVLGTLVLAKFEVRHFHISSPKALLSAHQGLLSWDGSWYQSIAAHGYGGSTSYSLRFFPLYPLLAAGFHLLPGVSVGVGLLVVANVSALLATMALYLLVRHELGDRVIATRAAWLLCIAPISFVLVMGYSEALFILLGVCCFYFLRTRSWWLAALCGYGAALSRPVGCFLAIAALVEILRAVPSEDRARWLARGAALIAPVLGVVTYLLFSWDRYHDFFAPFSVQLTSSLHGGATDPVVTLWHAATHVAHGSHIDTGIFWFAAGVVLLVICFRRLPASYGLFVVAALALALSGQNLNSFERYTLGAFPLLIAASTLLRSERVAISVYCLCIAGLVGYGLLAFQGAFVP